MSLFSRRAFLASSLTGLVASSHLVGKDDKSEGLNKAIDEPTFQPNTLFLTWRRDPTTTMMVQWVGTIGETSDTRIYYRPLVTTTHSAVASLVGTAAKGWVLPSSHSLGTYPWQIQPIQANPYPLSDFKVFRAELTNLHPGTDYEFRIGKHSPIYRFRTMPAKATNTIHFVSGGDCGFNVHTVANNQQAAKQDPMFAVIGGDLGYDNGRSVEISLAFLRNYSKHMVGRNGRLIPMIAGIGNHEVDGGYGKSRAKAPFFYSLFDGLYPETGYASLDFGDYLSLIMLDTGHTTAIGGDQANWLEKQLRARKDHPHVIVVNHVPAYPSFRKMEGVAGKEGTGEGNRKHWVPLFETYRVPVVLEHHDHTFKRTKPLLNGLAHDNGVLYLGDGSWGRLRAPQPPEKLSHLATASRDYHLSLHRLQGEERFHLALDETGRVMDVSRSGQRRTRLISSSG